MSGRRHYGPPPDSVTIGLSKEDHFVAPTTKRHYGSQMGHVPMWDTTAEKKVEEVEEPTATSSNGDGHQVNMETERGQFGFQTDDDVDKTAGVSRHHLTTEKRHFGFQLDDEVDQATGQVKHNGSAINHLESGRSTGKRHFETVNVDHIILG